MKLGYMSNQVISHKVITGEQGKTYYETLPAPWNAMIRNSQEACRSRKQILTVLIYHVTKSTYYESLIVTLINIIMNYNRRE